MLEKHPLCEEDHPLVVRNSDYGKFFGCLTYPEHKVIVTRPNCPDGHIMRLIDGPHGEFFGCEEYRTLNCPTTYNFEPKDKRYHAMLWEEWKSLGDYLSPEGDGDSNPVSTKPPDPSKPPSIPPVAIEADIESESEDYNYKEELKKHLDELAEYREKSGEIQKTTYEKASPDGDVRKIEGLTPEELEEYNRLCSNDYDSHMLFKVPEQLLSSYLQKSIKNKRLLDNN
tara:strand:+ start:117 stop:797 length:681 start_codon:yes stop_codon:yes gene_type:complete